MKAELFWTGYNTVHMKIAITLTGATFRKKLWNGFDMRYRDIGVSGTELAQVVMAEKLAAAGHEVVMWSDMYFPSYVNGVKYSIKEDDIIDAEVLITVDWVQRFMHFPRLHTLIIHFHCARCEQNIQNLIHVNQHAKTIVGVHISPWGAYHVRKDHLFTQLIPKETIIPNPLMMDVIKEVDDLSIQKHPRSFMYAAAWERGGHLALKIYDRMKETTWKDQSTVFTIMDYYTASQIPKDRDDIDIIISGDKESVMKKWAAASYFIYPLVLPNGHVHKDTFACCVAEAIAMGVIVITWPIATLPDTYKDLAVFIDLPEDHQSNLLTREVTFDQSLISDKAVQAFVDKINEIESNPELKKHLLVRGKQKVRELYSDDVIGRYWCELIDHCSSLI